MKRIKEMIRNKKDGISDTEKKEKSLLEETLDKTKELLEIIEKKERIYKSKNIRITQKNTSLDLFNQENKNDVEQLTNKEKNVLKNWKIQMNKLDEDLEELYDNLVSIGGRLKNIDKAMDDNMKIVDGMQPSLNKLDSNLQGVNLRLKNSLKKMRDPNKLCMDIFLMFVLAVLTAVLIWMFKFYWNMNQYD